MNNDELIKNIIIQVLSTINKKILLFISGGGVNIKDIFNTLESFKFINYEIVMSEAANGVIPEEFINKLEGKIIRDKSSMTLSIKESELILIPVLTRNTLAKVALGISDNLLTLGISESIMMNKNIIALSDSFHPSNPVNISLGYSQNDYYNKFILNYKDVLESMGVKFIQSVELKNRIYEELFHMNMALEKKKNNENKQTQVHNIETRCKGMKFNSNILTVDDIISCLNGKNEMYISRNVIITPLAKDFIYNNNIVINYID